MEVPSPFAGTVKEIKINTGDKVSTGSLIMVFEVAGAAGAAAGRLSGCGSSSSGGSGGFRF
ncbi:biotin/lipoyl-containing protein [Escherichia coli]